MLWVSNCRASHKLACPNFPRKLPRLASITWAVEGRTCRLVRDILPYIVTGAIPFGGEAMAIGIGRRQFISAVGGAAAAWPLTGHAQHPMIPVIGWLRSVSFSDAASLIAGFRHGLEGLGFTDGDNVLIELHSPEGDKEQISRLADEMIQRPVAVFIGNTEAARAAKAVSTTVPILFVTGFDPVKDGLVTSLNRPGANVTGVTFIGGMLGGKRLELLRQVTPKGAPIGVLVNPNSSDNEANRRDVQAAAASSGQQLIIVDVRSASDIDTAFTTFIQRGVGAVLTGAGAFFFSNRKQLVALATKYRLPLSFDVRIGAEAGGLMSYGPSIVDAYRQAGVYAGRILKGEKPSDLPVMQSTIFELVLNLKTAKALDIQIPPTLLALADEVIE
jgi:putative ABC transport system substrate-binding protein